jgi:hypothetical protein
VHEQSEINVLRHVVSRREDVTIEGGRSQVNARYCMEQFVERILERANLPSLVFWMEVLPNVHTRVLDGSSL